jgi:hypothetical protein
VREHVASARLRAREMFVPLSHRPGHAQADFGEADGYIGGKKVRFHYFCMDLPHCFVKAYPAETAEAFCDGHVTAFDFFGGVYYGRYHKSALSRVLMHLDLRLACWAMSKYRRLLPSSRTLSRTSAKG